MKFCPCSVRLCHEVLFDFERKWGCSISTHFCLQRDAIVQFIESSSVSLAERDSYFLCSLLAVDFGFFIGSERGVKNHTAHRSSSLTFAESLAVLPCHQQENSGLGTS